MSVPIALLQLVRAGNLIIMLATLGLSYYCLTDYLTIEDLFHFRFVLLAYCVVAIGASGYIINDYHDVQIDLTNKPQKVIIGKLISRRWAMLLHFTLNVTAILVGFYLNAAIGIMVMICGVLLWLYSVHFKKQFLSGNILVAALSSLVIIILPLFDKEISGYLVWCYACFAFGISLLREIVKDAEDLRGDSKFDCKTLPIILGIRKTKKILTTLLIVYVCLIFIHVFIANSHIPFRHDYGNITYNFYMLLFVCIPLLVITYMLQRADVKSDFSLLSTLLKVIMISGLLSMVIIKI
ncbi:MAG: geranylgeranylglycerol-phosphate geranylgeranyltransferase [Bacteroidia bacterium]|jgi:4-hydroxybenzoate polyprenyltransferase|nr:geranylgeranylglycerol-phosphate geranylgeranyltransferase [Bacteroidia bacterium]